MSYDYTIIRSKRKSLSVKINDELKIEVRAPMIFPKPEIDRFLDSHSGWIENTIGKKRRQLEKYPEPDDLEAARLRAQAKALLPARVEHWAGMMGLKPDAVKITSAKKRFGTCVKRGSQAGGYKFTLCFSWRLMRYPDEAVDYVVVHELCHMRHMNHSAAFYGEVEKYLPDYRRARDMLNGADGE